MTDLWRLVLAVLKEIFHSRSIEATRLHVQLGKCDLITGKSTDRMTAALRFVLPPW